MAFPKKLLLGITAPQSSVLLKGQIQYFVAKGYQIFLLAPEDKQTSDLCEQEGALLLPLKIRREISLFRDLISFFHILRLLFRIKPDIINLGTPKISLLGMMAAKITGVKKRIYTCRGFRFEHEKGFFKNLLLSMEKITSRSATHVLCISDSVKDLGVVNNIFSIEKATVIHKGSSNGVDMTRFNRGNLNAKKLEALKLHYNPNNYFVYGYVGRIISRKGFHELLAAFDRIYQDNPNVKLLVVGRPYYDQIEKEIIDVAIEHPGIEMIGLLDNKETPYYYALMDTFILPAYWEGFGNVLLEAAAMGIPVIATDVTGCRDAVSNEYNGVLIQPRNVESLYQAMKSFKNNPEKLTQYSKNALTWVQNFKPEIIWQGMEEMYKKGIRDDYLSSPPRSS